MSDGFPLAISNGEPTPQQIARGRAIAAEYPGVCIPARIEQCGVSERGERVHGCRCLDEARAAGSA